MAFCCYHALPQAATPCCHHYCHCLSKGSIDGAGMTVCGGGSCSSGSDSRSGGGGSGGSSAILLLVVVVILQLLVILLVDIVLPLFISRCSFCKPPLTCLQRSH